MRYLTSSRDYNSLLGLYWELRIFTDSSEILKMWMTFRGKKYISRDSPQVISLRCPLWREDTAPEVQRYQENLEVQHSQVNPFQPSKFSESHLLTTTALIKGNAQKLNVPHVFCNCSTLVIKSWTCFFSVITPPVAGNIQCKKAFLIF